MMSMLLTNISSADYCSAKGGGHNKFLEISSPLLPPAIGVWSDTLAAIDTNPENIINQASSPTDHGYVFPDPGLFTGCVSEDKMTQYLHQWLHLRTAFIYCLSTPSSSAQPLGGQVWCDLLNFSDAKQPSGSKSTKSSHFTETLKELLSDCLHQTGVKLALSDPVTPMFWRESELMPGVLINTALSRRFSTNCLASTFTMNS